MRLDPTATEVGLTALAAASVAIFATRWKPARSWAITLFTLAILDLVANLTGFGPLFWWSPIHWPSTVLFGADEILENHGVIKTTAGYMLDIIAWSLAIALGITLWRRKKKAPNQAVEATPLRGSPHR